jgi:hypothetical protein
MLSFLFAPKTERGMMAGAIAVAARKVLRFMICPDIKTEFGRTASVTNPLR